MWGLGGESAQLVIDRIYHNAEAIGLELNEEPGCAANIILAFVPDPYAEFAELRKANHYLVADLDLSARKRVPQQEGPVLAWNLVSTRTRDGQTRLGDPPVFESTTISRTETGIRKDIEVSVLMIDTDAIADKDGVAVADYATMRSLARTSPPEDEASFGTILALFDEDGSAPDRLSNFDLAYLRSLYSSRANRPSGMALNGIEALMNRRQRANKAAPGLF